MNPYPQFFVLSYVILTTAIYERVWYIIERWLEHPSLALGEAARHQGNIGDAFKYQARYAEAIPYFEDAIPYLRLRGKTFFLCWVLVSYAECLLEVGDREGAKRANQEGGRLAVEAGREFYQFASMLLAERVQVNADNLQATVARLQELRSQQESEETIAEIDYALWRIGGDETSKAAAAQSFLQVYESTKRKLYYARYRLLAKEVDPQRAE